MRLQSVTRNSYNQWQIIELRIVMETRETSPNAAKCQFFSSRTFDHRRKGAKCASLAFEILSEQYLIWAFTGVTIARTHASKGMAGAHEPSRLGA